MDLNSRGYGKCKFKRSVIEANIKNFNFKILIQKFNIFFKLSNSDLELFPRICPRTVPNRTLIKLIKPISQKLLERN